MNTTPINIQQKFRLFSDQWSPKIIAKMNDVHVKLARIEGDFIWHRHSNTDEVFLVIEGELRIDFRDRSVTLHEGELIVVPKDVEHKPFAAKECKILLIEPAGTVNTGDTGSDRTAEDNVWI